MDNKRNYPRYTIELSGRYTTSGPSTPMHGTMVVINIAAGGLCFVSENNFPPDTKIDLEIDLGDNEKVLLKTRVMWSEKIPEAPMFRMGVKTLNSTHQIDEEKFIKFYCHKLWNIAQTKRKILIVEDETDMMTLLKVELESGNYDVICAIDGEEGYQQYLSEQPDMIILDIGLPKLNGYELCRKIRREKKDERIPILMLTAKAEDVDRIRGRVIGAQKYMTKPFEVEELLRQVKDMLA